MMINIQLLIVNCFTIGKLLFEIPVLTRIIALCIPASIIVSLLWCVENVGLNSSLIGILTDILMGILTALLFCMSVLFLISIWNLFLLSTTRKSKIAATVLVASDFGMIAYFRTTIAGIIICFGKVIRCCMATYLALIIMASFLLQNGLFPIGSITFTSLAVVFCYTTVLFSGGDLRRPVGELIAVQKYIAQLESISAIDSFVDPIIAFSKGSCLKKKGNAVAFWNVMVKGIASPRQILIANRIQCIFFSNMFYKIHRMPALAG